MNNEFLEIYKEIKPKLREIFDKEYATHLQKEDKDSTWGLEMYAYMAYTGTSINLNEEIDNTKLEEAKQDEMFCIYEFLAMTGILGYFCHTKLDKKLDKSFSIGYKKSFKNIKVALADKHIGNKKTEAKVSTNFFSHQRECSKEEYISTEKYVDDVKLVKFFLTDESTIDKDKYEITETAYLDQINKIIDNLRDCYREMLSASYGLKEYTGVFTFDNSNGREAVVCVDESGNISTVEPKETLRELYEDVLKNADIYGGKGESNVKLQVNTGRVFDIGLIAKATRSKQPVRLYFPYKILEIISKCKYFSNASSGVGYQPCENKYKKNIETYLDYLLPTTSKLDDLNDNLELNKSKLDKKFKGKEDSLTEDEKDEYNKLKETIDLTESYNKLQMLNLRGQLIEFLVLLSDDMFVRSGKDKEYTYIEFFSQTCRDEKRREIIDIVSKAAHYFADTVSTYYILSDLTVKKPHRRGEIASITSYRIKVATQKDVPLLEDGAFEKAIYQKNLTGVKMSADEEKNIDKQSAKSLGIFNLKSIEYSYTYDVTLVEGRPLFALKALDALKRQGVSPSYNDVMLGKKPNGAIYRTNIGSHSVHQIWAGSRSGKGVMGYNIFATAIGAGIPIFYLDRKPDTSVVMKELNPNIFAVNGSQYDDSFDYNHVFPSSIDPSNYVIPKYLMNTPISSNPGDFAYIRGALLYLEILSFLDAKTLPPHLTTVRDKMKGVLGKNKVLMLVLDEFTNFSDGLGEDFSFFGTFGQEAYTNKGIAKWSSFSSEMKSQSINLNSLIASNEGGKKDAQIAKAQGKLEEAEFNAKEYKLSGIYYAQVMNNFETLISRIGELQRAGGDYTKVAQIYFIGQQVITDKKYNNGITVPSMNDSPSAKRYKSTGCDIVGKHNYLYHTILQGLGERGSDAFLGYNVNDGIGKGETLGQQYKSLRTSRYLTGESRYFAYTDVKDMHMVGNLVEDAGGVDKAKAWLDENVTLFKPFLILNNGESLPQDLQYTITKDELDSRGDRVQARTSGNIQYIGQCVNFSNIAGVTYNDFLDEVGTDDGNLDRRIGFPDYIADMFGGGDFTEPMGYSGKIANIYVQEVYGYNGTAEEFCRDFSPEYILDCRRSMGKFESTELGDVIKESLQESFFNPALTKDDSFASTFKDLLSSLMLSLYGTSSGSDSDLIGDSEDDFSASSNTGNFAEDEDDFVTSGNTGSFNDLDGEDNYDDTDSNDDSYDDTDSDSDDEDDYYNDDYDADEEPEAEDDYDNDVSFGEDEVIHTHRNVEDTYAEKAKSKTQVPPPRVDTAELFTIVLDYIDRHRPDLKSNNRVLANTVASLSDKVMNGETTMEELKAIQ